MTQAYNLSQFANKLNSSGQTSNSGLQNTAVTVTAGTGLSGGGSVALGSSVTLANAGVTAITAGTGISVSGSTGNVTITNTNVFTGSISLNGYQNFPNGLIIQWGTATAGATSGTSASVTYPRTFPNGTFSVTATFNQNGVGVAGVSSLLVQSTSTSGFVVIRGNYANLDSYTQFTWIAIGY